MRMRVNVYEVLMRNADHRSRHETVFLTQEFSSVSRIIVNIRMRMPINTSALLSMGATASVLILSERECAGCNSYAGKKQRRFCAGVLARCARQW